MCDGSRAMLSGGAAASRRQGGGWPWQQPTNQEAVPRQCSPPIQGYVGGQLQLELAFHLDSARIIAWLDAFQRL